MQSIVEKNTVVEGCKFVLLDDINNEFKLGRYVIISCIEWRGEVIIERYDINLNCIEQSKKILNLLVSTWNNGHTHKVLV